MTAAARPDAWDDAFEAAGLWPIAVELPNGQVRFVLWYHRADGEDRIVVRNGCVPDLSRLDHAADIILDNVYKPSNRSDDPLLSLADRIRTGSPPEETIPRCLLRQAIEWLQGEMGITLKDQASELLKTIDLLRDWHLTLEEIELVGKWPRELDAAADILADSVLFGELVAPIAGSRVAALGLGHVLAQEAAELVRCICTRQGD